MDYKQYFNIDEPEIELPSLMSSQTRLATNHGCLKLQPFLSSESNCVSEDCNYIKTNHESDFYLSPLQPQTATETSIGNTIPGMQEVFTKFPRPHPSPILAATLSRCANYVDTHLDVGANKLTSNAIPLTRTLCFDSIDRLQTYSKSTIPVETSSSSSVDLTEFPSSPISGAFAEFNSLNYASLNLDCSSSANVSLSTENSALTQCIDEEDCLPVCNNCPLNLDDEETDLVPSELIQFVSESTRQIPGDLVDVVSVGDSDMEDLDHEARLASLCIPILHPPSLVHSQLPDSTQPPSLSPESRACSTSPFEQIDMPNNPSFDKTCCNRPSCCRASCGDEHHISSPPSVVHSSPSDDLTTCVNVMLTNDIQSPCHLSITESHSNSPNTLSNIHPTCLSKSFEGNSVCSDEVVTHSNAIYSERLRPVTICEKYDIETPFLSDRINQNEEKTNFSTQTFQHQLVLKDALTQSVSSIDTLSTRSSNNTVLTTVSKRPISTNGTHTTSVPSVLNLVLATSGKKPITLSNKNSNDQVSEEQNYDTSLNFAAQSVQLGEASHIPGGKFTSTIQNTHENNSLMGDNPVHQTSLPIRTIFDHSNMVNAVETPLLTSTPNKAFKQLVMSSEMRPCLMSTPLADYGFLNVNTSISSNSSLSVNGYLNEFSTFDQKGSVSAPTTLVLPTSVNTQSPYVCTTSVASDVGNSTIIQSNSFVLPFKNRTLNDTSTSSQTQSSNVTTSPGCFVLPLQILNSLPALRPGMSILLNVKNNSTIKPNLQPCLSSVTTSNTTEMNGIASETNGSVFLLPGNGLVTSLNSGATSNIPIIQLPSQQRINLFPSNLSNSLLSPPSGASNLCTNNSIIANNFTTVQDNKQPTSSTLSLPLGTQFFILRSACKPNVVNSIFSPNSAPNFPLNGGFVPVPTSSAGLTVLLANPHSKSQSDSGNFIFVPTATSKSSLFSYSSIPLAPNFSSVASSLINTPSWNPVSSVNDQTNEALTNASNLNIDVNTSNLNETVITSGSSDLMSQPLDSYGSSSLSFPLTLLPTINPQTMLVSSSWPSVSPVTANIVSSQPPTNHAFLSPATTLSSSMSSSSCLSFDNNSLPSPPVPYSNSSESTKPSYSPPTTSSIVVPLLPSLSSLTPSTKDSSQNIISIEQQQQSELKKNVIVLPSADKLLSSSRNYSQLLTLAPLRNSKLSDPKCRRLSYSSSATTSIPSTAITSLCTVLQSTSTSTTSTTTTTCSYRRKHQCPYCPKSCERKDNLQAHIRTHTGERPYPCRFCPKAFPQKDHLRAHIRTHTGEKPYRCPQCSKAFAQLGNLHRHVKTHRR